MDGLTISDVAAATGFTASTIRYYERIGLLPPPGRSASGYRLYGADALERLRFVARAKRLGLALDEVAELLRYWSDGACSTTRERLQLLLADKLKEVRRRIDDLTMLGGQLEEAYGRLAGHTPQTRCGPACGCPPDVHSDEELHLLDPFGA